MDIRIIEFLASRMCHDLISPIGAVHNGIEFLQDMGAEGVDDAIGLIAHSSSQASARLQLFRLVYGAGVKTTALELSDIHSVMENYLKGDDKISQQWDPKAPLVEGTPSTGLCKMLLATLVIAHECLPKGGIIKVEKGPDGFVLVHASGENAQPRQGTERGLAGDLDLDEMDPRLVHSYVTWLMGQSYGFDVNIDTQEANLVTLRLKGEG